MGTGVPHLPELWAEPHAFPFFLSARSRLCGGRPCGILFAARRTELAEPRGEAGERNVYRPLFDGRNAAHEQGVWQLCFVLHDGLRQRTGGQLGGLGERFRGLLEEDGQSSCIHRRVGRRRLGLAA